MKKSKAIQLVLITAALAGCATEKKKDWGDNGPKTYVRGDSTAPYARSHYGMGGLGTAALWYLAFRPMYGGGRNATGYYSGGIPHAANVGSNRLKTSIPRGGFGRTGYRTSSAS